MSLFALNPSNPRHVQATADQLFLVRKNPAKMPSQNVMKSMQQDRDKAHTYANMCKSPTYASRLRQHILEVMRNSKTNPPTQNESCTLVCKLMTMTQKDYNDPDYYMSVQGLEMRAIQDWEAVHGKNQESEDSAASVAVLKLSRGQKAAATRKLKKAQELAMQQRVAAKKAGKGAGKQRARAVGTKPARAVGTKPARAVGTKQARAGVEKLSIGLGGQNRLGLGNPPPPSVAPPNDEGCSAKAGHQRSKKQAKVAADPHVAFEQSMSEVKSVWEEQQKLMHRMAHAIAACNENAERVQALVAEREAELEAKYEEKLAAAKEKIRREARKAVLREMLEKMEESEGSDGDGEESGGEGSDENKSDGNGQAT